MNKDFEFALLVIEALGLPTRQRILELFEEKKVWNSSAIADRLNVSRPLITYHIAALIKIKVLSAQKNGKWIEIQRNTKNLKQADKAVKALFKNLESLTV